MEIKLIGKMLFCMASISLKLLIVQLTAVYPMMLSQRSVGILKQPYAVIISMKREKCLLGIRKCILIGFNRRLLKHILGLYFKYQKHLLLQNVFKKLKL